MTNKYYFCDKSNYQKKGNMYKLKCPICKSNKIVRNGTRNGIQLYKCSVCKHQFRKFIELSLTDLWNKYQDGKQTIKELSIFYKVSESTIKRTLQKIGLMDKSGAIL